MSDFLRVLKLCKSFRSGPERLDILIDLNLDLRAGCMLAVTGASGSGKSTLLHLIGGMEKSDSGQILVNGCDITRLPGPALAQYRNQDVGFVFQFHHLLPEFSALENVMFPLLLRATPPGVAATQARLLLEEVGLGGRGTHRPGELSGGEQQRVALARALVGRPIFLLADEPTGNLDLHTSEAVFALLRQMHARHRLTSIVVTHNPLLAAQCDAELRLAEGRLQPVTPPR